MHEVRGKQFPYSIQALQLSGKQRKTKGATGNKYILTRSLSDGTSLNTFTGFALSFPNGNVNKNRNKRSGNTVYGQDNIVFNEYSQNIRLQMDTYNNYGSSGSDARSVQGNQGAPKDKVTYGQQNTVLGKYLWNVGHHADTFNDFSDTSSTNSSQGVPRQNSFPWYITEGQYRNLDDKFSNKNNSFVPGDNHKPAAVYGYRNIVHGLYNYSAGNTAHTYNRYGTAF